MRLPKILAGAVLLAGLLIQGCGVSPAQPLGNLVARGMDYGVTIHTSVSGGSGAFVGPNLILTAKHVIMDYAGNPRKELWIVLPEHDGYDSHDFRVPVEVVAFPEGQTVNEDWALLRVVKKDFSHSYAPLACRTPVIGERVVGIGNALLTIGLQAFPGIVTNGSVELPRWQSDTDAARYWKEVFLSTMGGAPGVSGGGVYTSHGSLIGMMVGAISGQSGVAYQLSYPIKRIHALCGPMDS